MTLATPKAESVTEQGDSDGWLPQAGFVQDLGPGMKAQLVVSVPHTHLLALHAELIGVLGAPLGVLYRQVVDRRDPKPQGAPPRDFVGLELDPAAVLAALREHTDLLHHDARCELWVKGPLGDQIILDTDGLLFLQPDDPAFRDVLLASGLAPDIAETIADRDYVKHWFHADNDAHEDAFIARLGLVKMAHRG